MAANDDGLLLLAAIGLGVWYLNRNKEEEVDDEDPPTEPPPQGPTEKDLIRMDREAGERDALDDQLAGDLPGDTGVDGTSPLDYHIPDVEVHEGVRIRNARGVVRSGRAWIPEEGNPTQGNRHEPRIIRCTTNDAVAHAAWRQHQTLFWTDAGFEYRDANGKQLIIIRQDDAYFMPHLVRREHVQAYRVGHWFKEERVSDDPNGRYMLNRNRDLFWRRQVERAPENWRRPGGGKQNLELVASHPSDMDSWIHDRGQRHAPSTSNPQINTYQGTNVEWLRRQCRIHPQTREPWKCFSFIRTHEVPENPDWVLCWFTPWYPAHRTWDGTTEIPATFEPHVGGGTRLTDAFAKWVRPHADGGYGATGDQPNDWWVGEVMSVPSGCVWIDNILRCEQPTLPSEPANPARNSSPCASIQRSWEDDDTSELWYVGDGFCPSLIDAWTDPDSTVAKTTGVAEINPQKERARRLPGPRELVVEI